VLGAGKRFQTAAQLSDASVLVNWLGWGSRSLGGFTLFATAAVGYIDNPGVSPQARSAVAAGFDVAHLRATKVAHLGPDTGNTRGAQARGLDEIVLWVSVATAAVWIPNY